MRLHSISGENDLDGGGGVGLSGKEHKPTQDGSG